MKGISRPLALFAVLIVECLGFVACFSDVPKVKPFILDGAGGQAELKEIFLRDNTHCAVLIGNAKAAISCDWK